MKKNDDNNNEINDNNNELKADTNIKYRFAGSSEPKPTTIQKIIDTWVYQVEQEAKNNEREKKLLKEIFFKKKIEEYKKTNLTDDELWTIVKQTITNRFLKTINEIKKQWPNININELCCMDDVYHTIWIENNTNDINFRISMLGLSFDGNNKSNPWYNYPPIKQHFIQDSENNVCGIEISKDLVNEEKQNISIKAMFSTIAGSSITIAFNRPSKTSNINEVVVEYKNIKDNKTNIFTISLQEDNTITEITKNNSTGNTQTIQQELKNLLFDDEINKYLTENIECELDSQQKVVFDKIKNYLGVVKEEKEEKKEDLNNSKNANININDKDIIENKSKLNHYSDNSDKEKDSEHREVEEIKNNQTTYNLGCIQNKWIGTPVNGEQNTFHCFCFDI